MLAMPSISPRDLPASARPIADVIGVEATLALAKLFGDPALKRRNRFHVPTLKNLSPNHRIAVVIGVDSARRLAATFGGELVTIPHCETALRQAAIWRDFMGGMPIPEIALKFDLSERRIRQITAEERGETPENFHQLIGAMPRTPERAAVDRLNGRLGGPAAAMLKQLISKLKEQPETPYGLLLTTVVAFRPTLTVQASEDSGFVVTPERAIEFIAAHLPAEITVLHNDHETLLTFKPTKLADRNAVLVLKVETPLSPKTISQNAMVAHALEALACSAKIDRLASAVPTQGG